MIVLYQQLQFESRSLLSFSN